MQAGTRPERARRNSQGLLAHAGNELGRGFTGVLTETPLKTPEKILAAMRHQADITIPELAHLLEKSESAVKRAIRKLRDADQIERIGGDKGGRWEVRS